MNDKNSENILAQEDDFELMEGFELDDQLEDDGDLLDLDLEQVGDESTGVATDSRQLWFRLAIASALIAAFAGLLLSPMYDARELLAAKVPSMLTTAQDLELTKQEALTPATKVSEVSQSRVELEGQFAQFFEPNNLSLGIFRKVAGNENVISAVQQNYDRYIELSDAYIAEEASIDRLKNLIANMQNVTRELSPVTLQFVEAVSKEGRNKSTGSSKDRYLALTSEASRLIGISAKVLELLDGYFAADVDQQRVLEQMNVNLIQYEDTLNRVVGNAAEIVATEAVPLQQRILAIRKLSTEASAVAENYSRAKNTLPVMQEQRNSINEGLSSLYGSRSMLDKILSLLAKILPVLMTVLTGFFLWRFFKAQNRRLEQQEVLLTETIEGQQNAILKLLDEMSALADGDLTLEAEVTDQVTGAIADSVNFAVIEMRELVSQISRASQQVGDESRKAVSSATEVSQSNVEQSKVISNAAEQMATISAQIRQMADNATNSSNMASESMKVATQGAQAVRDTIDGMNDMRDQIQETSKRIKRLGESSQRIGEIVALIDDIAEQTNILSLNAAIQASMAGEAGRGFAVVSDEVQSLAERSTEATQKIAELVTLIQTDTNDAMQSMERATQQVVSGTKIADSAGESLAEIEDVSQKLSDLVANIAKTSSQQAAEVSDMSQSVAQVREETTATSEKANQSAQAISKLLELAKELEVSVSRFRLPQSQV